MRRDRSDLGATLVPGRRAVIELLRAGRRGVREVWIARDRDPSDTLEEIERLASDARVPSRVVDAERLRTEAGIETHQGVVARAAPLQARALDDLAAAPNAFLVVLDGVTDPRNLGAVLRSAVAAGATGAVFPRHRSARLTPAAVKAAAGAIEYLDLALVAGIPSTLEQLRRDDVWVVGLDAGGTVSIYDVPVTDAPVALVLGAEGAGLARLTRERCDVLARVPMRGALDSLNVAAAASVACFEVARRRDR